METLLHEPIRDVIARYPTIGALLAEHGIDCITCSVGTCLLKDVLSVHGFPARQEQQLLDEIRSLANQDAPDPSIELALKNKGPAILCGPIMDLVAEHARIQRMISLIPRFLARGDYWDDDRKWLEGIIRFIRLYADRFHHAKEEDLLFKAAGSEHAIIKAMVGEHQLGREYISLADAGLSAGDAEKLETGFNRYVDLLLAHIRHEDEILFPWLDHSLSMEQKEELTESFDRLDTREGSALEADMDIFIESAENHMVHVKSDVYFFTSSRDRTIERLVNDPATSISHIILPAGGSVAGHKTTTGVYFILIRGVMTVRYSPMQEEKHVQGHIVHMPPDTWMELRNEGPGTFEAFVVRAPNPDS
jgi:hemerythrin-like domain-containing protein